MLLMTSDALYWVGGHRLG